ncbi:MAG: glycosyltransferase family 8 protein [Candidatus Gracilibacteria bacterium]|nr:glycosyltransferase family 8 protein [Candidatus Gracilibacteria bacterium]
MSKKIEICFCIDDGYVKHCLTTIISIVENSKKNYYLSFNILTDYISIDKKEIIKNIEKKYGISIKVIEIDNKKYENINLGKYGKYILYRLDCCNYIEAEKILYLDSDTIILGDISEIWDIELGEKIVGAVQQDKPNSFPLSIDYFNSGLLIINKNNWLENNVANKVIDFLKSNGHYGWPDQDGLNFVLKNNWIKLPSEWNCLNFYNKKLNTKLFHFAGLKPWRWESLNPYNVEYYKYLYKTGLYNKTDKIHYIWNKAINIIPLFIRIFIDKVIYLNLYYLKEYLKKRLG